MDATVNSRVAPIISGKVPLTGDLAPGNALVAGMRLREFEIVETLGEGGFSIVYGARDLQLMRDVAIKEYIPISLAGRVASTTVRIRSEHNRETFEAGLNGFINEARLLAQFKHPGLVEVLQFWEENGTAYMVMPRYTGKTLRSVLKEMGGRGDEPWLRGIVAPVLDVLDLLHSRNVFHRDIAPDNILIKNDGTPVLLDLGSAREVVTGLQKAITVVVKPGYAPIEQYSSDFALPQGPWTDVYAVGALLHFALVGSPPPASISRIMKDSLQPLASAGLSGYSREFLTAVDRALALQPGDRPQSIGELRDLLRVTENDKTIISLAVAEPLVIAEAAPLIEIESVLPEPPAPREAEDERTVIVSAQEVAELVRQLAGAKAAAAAAAAAPAKAAPAAPAVPVAAAAVVAAPVITVPPPASAFAAPVATPEPAADASLAALLADLPPLGDVLLENALPAAPLSAASPPVASVSAPAAPVFAAPIVEPAPVAPVFAAPVVEPTPVTPVFAAPVVEPMPVAPVFAAPIVEPTPVAPVFAPPVVEPTQVAPVFAAPIPEPTLVAPLIEPPVLPDPLVSPPAPVVFAAPVIEAAPVIPAPVEPAAIIPPPAIPAAVEAAAPAPATLPPARSFIIDTVPLSLAEPAPLAVPPVSAAPVPVPEFTLEPMDVAAPAVAEPVVISEFRFEAELVPAAAATPAAAVVAAAPVTAPVVPPATAAASAAAVPPAAPPSADTDATVVMQAPRALVEAAQAAAPRAEARRTPPPVAPAQLASRPPPAPARPAAPANDATVVMPAPDALALARSLGAATPPAAAANANDATLVMPAPVPPSAASALDLDPLAAPTRQPKVESNSFPEMEDLLSGRLTPESRPVAVPAIRTPASGAPVEAVAGDQGRPARPWLIPAAIAAAIVIASVVAWRLLSGPGQAPTPPPVVETAPPAAPAEVASSEPATSAVADPAAAPAVSSEAGSVPAPATDPNAAAPVTTADAGTVPPVTDPNAPAVAVETVPPPVADNSQVLAPLTQPTETTSAALEAPGQTLPVAPPPVEPAAAEPVAAVPPPATPAAAPPSADTVKTVDVSGANPRRTDEATARPRDAAGGSRPRRDAKPAVATVGNVKLSIQPWGEVWINGSLRGVSPPMRFLQLEPGTYNVELRNPGLQSARRQLTVTAGQPTSIEHRFQSAGTGAGQ